MEEIVIVSAARTPMAAFQGEFASVTAPQLGAVAIRAAVERAGLKPEQVEEVVSAACCRLARARLRRARPRWRAGLPLGVGCTTVNKMCGSGMRAAMTVYDGLIAGSFEIAIAGGMESMTNAPYLVPKGRGGYRIGHGMIYDHMMLDGLEDAYDKGRSMGTFGEDCAAKYGFTREQQDTFAMESVRRAQQATENGDFRWEIAPVTVSGKGGDTVIDTDEGPRRIKLDKIPSLKPAFAKDGTITAASSSSINDGASALVMMRASTAKQLGLQPIARMLGHTTHAQAPGWFTTAPVEAIAKLYRKLDWTTDSVDLFEINEAFAVVPMAAMHDLKIPRDKVNIHGGACALGHPIGASGARIMTTLIGALRKTGGKRGVASLCIGGGEATAVGIEIL